MAPVLRLGISPLALGTWLKENEKGKAPTNELFLLARAQLSSQLRLAIQLHSDGSPVSLQ